MTIHPNGPADTKAAGPVVRLGKLPRSSEPATGEDSEAAPAGRLGAEPGATLTVAEAATLLGVSTWLVQQQVVRGARPAVRLGRRILISRSRLLAWLDDRTGPERGG
ncbi:MAG: hypothetical protein NVS3B26_28950 [Mycobacteriales bacterium]